jgi:formate dehydrogenase major subunit
VSLSQSIARWPLLGQLRGDPLGVASAARSDRSRRLRPRTAGADRVVHSVCPYCAVGCGQLVHVSDGNISHIDGDPASPISRGRLCPKGQGSKGYVSGPLRQYEVLYRRPYGTEWERLDLEQAMEMIADRIIETRERTWQSETDDGVRVNRTMGIGNLGGATLDNEENYLIKKLLVGLGVVQVENQARI